MLNIFIDADACPVKNEVYRVASRYSLNVTLVANSRMRVPNERWITLEIVEDGLDAVDDWIVLTSSLCTFLLTFPLRQASLRITISVQLDIRLP